MSEGMLFDHSAERDGACDIKRPDERRLSLAGDVVLVTGASGFVGSAIARRLGETGCTLRTLVRSTSPRGNTDGLGIELFDGDMRDPRAVGEAMKGVRFLFHAAADYRLWALDPTEIVDANERGTRVVMETARAAGVERVIHTSSVATLKPSCGGLPSSEGDRLRAEDAPGAYKRSKVLAERLVDRMVEAGLPAIIVHPSTPIGPGDIKPTPTGRIIVEAARGRIPAFVETGLNLVHVDDVADGHVRALERGLTGQHYILGGQDVGFGTMLADIAALTGRRAPKLRLPHGVIYPIACAAEAVARVTRNEPFVSLDSLRMSRNLMYYSSARAASELGYKARPYRQALEDAVRWFMKRGYVPMSSTGTWQAKLSAAANKVLSSH